MKRYIVAGCCLVIIFVLAAVVTPYILPARQILTFMTDEIGSGSALLVSQKTVVYDPGLEGGMQEFDEALYYAYPDRFRSEVNTPAGEQIRVVDPEGALVVIDGKIIGDKESPLDYFKTPLLYRETDLLLQRLSQLGIDLEIVSLGRFKDKIAYVIGAKYPDESIPQVWIDKDTFKPVRLLLGGDRDGPLTEIEYMDYKPVGKGKSYPGRILFLEESALVRMYVVASFKIDPEVPDELFDVAYLKQSYEPLSPPASLPTSPEDKSELDEVKESIRDFRKIFE